MKLHGRNLTLHMHGDDVRQLQRDLTWLGFSILSDEIRSQYFGESTRAAVKAFHIGSDGVVGAVTVEKINHDLTFLKRTVRGKFRSADGNPLRGKTVRVYDKDLRDERELGDESTNDDGYFEIEYQSHFKPEPNLIVKGFADSSGTEPLAVSKVRFEASPDLVINLMMMGETEYRGLSDFELVERDISSILPSTDQTLKIADLTEDEEHQDVTFLGSQTGHTADRLVHMVLSHRNAKKSELGPQVFYAFQRQGLPAETSALLSQDPSVLSRALVQAAKNNLIPEKFGTDDLITHTLNQLKPLRAKVALEAPLDPKKTTLGTVVKTVVTEQQAQEKFMTTFAEHEGTLGEFWDKLNNSVEFPELAPHASDLKLAVALSNIGQNHLPLVKAVRHAGFRDVKQLVSLNEDAWLTLIIQGGSTPDWIEGANEEEKARRYAQTLLAAVEAREPTKFFANRLRETEHAGKDDLLKFLVRSDFDIKSTRPESFLETHPDLLNSLTDKDAAVKQLKGLQRLYHLQPSVKPALALQQAGIDSAQRISQMGENAFVTNYGQNFGDTTQAKNVYARARQVSAAAIAIIGDVNPAMNRVQMRAVPDTVATEVAQIPNWSNLFGSLDFCSCGHCQSVYSPAAYLVDLLDFLNHRQTSVPESPDTETSTVKDKLFERRPDLGEIELTCENSNTVLPYIDLVLEVLEDAVAQPPEFTSPNLNSSEIAELDARNVSDQTRTAFAGKLVDPVSVRVKRPGEWWVIDDARFSYAVRKQEDGNLKVETRSRQTSGSTAERRATPQYRNDDAYTELGQAVYPWSLPFDLYEEEARTFLKHLGTSRLELIETLNLESVPFDPNSELNVRLAGQRLGLTDAERRLIANDNAPGQFEDYWANTSVEDLRTVRTLLDRSGLSYSELEAILELRLIDPQGTLEISQKPNTPVDPCGTENLHIEFLDENVLGRMHRFIRLLRKLKWTIPELGEAARAFFGTIIDLANDVLVRLSHVVAVRSVLRISVSQTLALLGIGTTVSEEVRDATLAKGLRISVSDLRIALQLLSHLEPFVANKSEDLLRFVETVKEIQVSGFSLVELDYLLQHKFNSASPFVPTPLSLTQILRDIRARLLDLKKQFETEGNRLFESSDSLLFRHGDLDLVNMAVRFRSDTDLLSKHLRTGLKAETEALLANFDVLSSLPVQLETALIDELNVLIKGPSLFDAQLFAHITLTAETRELLTQTLQGEALIRLNRLLLHEAYPLARALSESLVNHCVATALAQSPNITAELLNRVSHTTKSAMTTLLELAEVSDGPLESPGDPRVRPQFETLQKLLKIATILNTLRLPVSLLGWLFRESELLLLADAQTTMPRFDDWRAVLELQQLRRELALNDAQLEAIVIAMDRVVSDTSSTTKQEFVTALSDWLGWRTADIEALVGKSDDPTDHGLLNANPGSYGVSLLVKLHRAVKLTRRLDVSPTTANQWCKGAITVSDAAAIRDAARHKYDHESWLKISTPLQNVLRDKQCEALVTYLTAQTDTVVTSPTAADASDLYAHFLIDVEMSSCMMTSRIKQAISSVQLFVQRCLLNIEPNILTSSQTTAAPEVDEAWNWWKWMKNYRVWEANRKVFLYPENWIEPELRDDKSPFFLELESELMEGDLTQDNAERAFLNYLEKLDLVARLTVMSVHHQKDSKNDILHVFARSQSPPHVYYYRQRVNAAYWTPWEKIDLDIEGDHLIPVVWNNRLFLFWPTFLEKTKPATINNPGAREFLFDQPYKYWEVRLNWSERKRNKWSGKRLSSQFVVIESINPNLPQPRDIFFSPSIQDNTLVIDQVLVRFRDTPSPPGTMARSLNPLEPTSSNSISIDFNNLENVDYGPGEGVNPTDWEAVINRFKFESCDLDPTIVTPPASSGGQTSLLGTKREYMSFIEKGESALLLPTRINLASSRAVLAQTPGPFRVIAQGADSNVAQHPFFFQDPSRAYLIVPTPAMFGDNVVDPSEVGSGGLATERLLSSGAQNTFNFSPATALAGDTHSTSAFVLHPNTTYTFHNFYHPYVGTLMSTLNRQGLDRMLSRDLQLEPYKFKPGPASPTPFNFQTVYAPDSQLVAQPYPTEQLEFGTNDPYSAYNWELFFHAPLLIADRLTKNQRFEEAANWFHYIFNPTDTSNKPEPQRYWQTKEFFEKTTEEYQQNRLTNLLRLLAETPTQPGDLERLKELRAAITAWKDSPFKPHLIARMRTTAYQKAVVMKYIDNLISWGDQLFRRDTLETLNEATQLYVLASDILGPRPLELEPRLTPRIQTFNSLEHLLGDFSSALVELEPFVSLDTETSESVPEQQPPTNLYFCLPKNDKLLGYWDTVADRLFKIRHCLNIEGVVRQLPLFEPPIDPALLVRAVAAGLDLQTVLNDDGALRPGYRFQMMAQKATELCGDLRSLGGALLSALEKRDAEQLSLLRAKHETALLEMMEQVKEKQLQEAEAAKTALQESRGLAASRYQHYQRLLGVEEPPVPAVDQAIPDFGPSALAKISVADGVGRIGHETAEMKSLESAARARNKATALSLLAAHFAPIPDVSAQPMGVGGYLVLHRLPSELAQMFSAEAEDSSYRAGQSSHNAQYVMRAHEWTLQNNLAAREIMQIDKQMIAAEIRIEIAQLDLRNHRRQMENANTVEEFMRDKYTNKELYSWMVGQLSGVYFQAYQLTYETARRAELCYQHELGISNSNFVQFGYWDSLRKGLLAGEKLHLDIKRLEMSYLDNNKREYELTKHVSLRQLNPLALLELKATGTCEVSVPEWVFDIDNPGHYLRRIKNASVSIPSVAGPYTSVSCTMSLLKSTVRKSPSGDDYKRDPNGDDRFVDYFGTIQSIVTSTGNNDGGLFETNLRDERFLPFEGAGAESTWKIELPAEFRQFDYDTISDVVLHLRYTARQGGNPLRDRAVGYLKELVTVANTEGLTLLFSLKHDFPNEWHRSLIENTSFVAKIKRDHFPYFTQGPDLTITRLQVYTIKAGRPELIITPASDLEALSRKLNEEGEVELPHVGNEVLVTNKEAGVFILINYSIASA